MTSDIPTLVMAGEYDPITPPRWSESAASTLGSSQWATDDVEIPEVVLVEFSQDILGVTITGVVPEVWEEQGLGVWARQADGFDQTALVQQGGFRSDPRASGRLYRGTVWPRGR